MVPKSLKRDGSAPVAALKQHYKGKPLLPGSFAKESHLEEVKGVYVPFWLFDGEAGIIGGAVISAIICAIMAGAMKTAHLKTDAHAYIPGSGVTITGRSDVFSHRTVSRQPINRDSGSKKPGGR